MFGYGNVFIRQGKDRPQFLRRKPTTRIGGLRQKNMIKSVADFSEHSLNIFAE